MHQRKERKNFLSMKEFREGAQQWLIDRNWSLNLNWDEMPHKSCVRPLKGEWKLVGYGYYENRDGEMTYYIGFRCSTCGTMVQFNQPEQVGDNPPAPLRRVVVQP